MVKVLDPEGIIIGVYERREDVPDRLPNRFHTHYYDRDEDCEVVEVTDPKDRERLMPSLRKAGKDWPGSAHEDTEVHGTPRRIAEQSEE